MGPEGSFAKAPVVQVHWNLISILQQPVSIPESIRLPLPKGQMQLSFSLKRGQLGHRGKKWTRPGRWHKATERESDPEGYGYSTGHLPQASRGDMSKLPLGSPFQEVVESVVVITVCTAHIIFTILGLRHLVKPPLQFFFSLLLTFRK